jgi:hypothetical protein
MTADVPTWGGIAACPVGPCGPEHMVCVIGHVRWLRGSESCHAGNLVILKHSSSTAGNECDTTQVVLGGRHGPAVVGVRGRPRPKVAGILTPDAAVVDMPRLLLPRRREHGRQLLLEEPAKTRSEHTKFPNLKVLIQRGEKLRLRRRRSLRLFLIL